MFRTDATGAYWFKGVKPKFYPIPDDGTVGNLLKGLGRHPFRLAHLYYIISADGFETLTTHIFDPDDPYIDSDGVFGVKQSLMAKLEPITAADAIKADAMRGPFLRVVHDFVLAPKA